jgi:hypothetical protein
MKNHEISLYNFSYFNILYFTYRRIGVYITSTFVVELIIQPQVTQQLR